MADTREWENFKNDLKQASDIVDVISMYTSVSKKGKSFMALCPLHGEKTASMSINREGQFFKCFGCGKGGDVFTFIQEIENCSFMEAIEILARRANMTIPQTNSSDKEILSRQKSREKYYEICRQTALHYHANLVGENGAAARKYLANRGISTATATAFGLGVSLGYNQLPNFLTQKGFASNDCEQARVLRLSSRGSYFDFLFGRLIVPIIDINGRVIAFGGRILDKQDGVAKYVNSSNSPIFEKNKNLFGINLVKKNKPVGKLPYILVLEGYMDVISMYQAGYHNVVASMGTSLTVEQAKSLKRLSDKVYICYDGDSAGQAATLRGLDILREQNIDVMVISLPDNLDPDDYIRKYGAEGFEQCISQALSLTDYKLLQIKKSLPISDSDQVKRKEARRKYLTAALEILRDLPSVDRESYIVQLASETAFTAEFIKKQLISPSSVTFSYQPIVVDQRIKALIFIASSIIYDKPFAVSAQKPFCDGAPQMDRLFDYVLDCKAKNIQIDKPSIVDYLEQDYDIADQVLSQEAFSQDASADKRFFEDCYHYCTLQHYENVKAELLTEYNQSTSDKKPEILSKITEVQNLIKEIKKQKIS